MDPVSNKEMISQNSINKKESKIKSEDQKVIKQSAKIGEASEAPELGSSKKPKLIRRSLPTPLEIKDIAAAESEEEAIASRSGELWECVGRKPTEFGCSYIFKLKDEYDSITPPPNENSLPKQEIEKKEEATTKKLKTIFPAAESGGEQFRLLDPSKREQLLQEKFEYLLTCYVNPEEVEEKLKAWKSLQSELHTTLNQLGYRSDYTKNGVYLTLPDANTLMGRWEELRKTKPELPELDIVSSDGIASDMSFIESYFTHTCLLSNGKEYAHDHIAHIMPTIGMMNEPKVDNVSYQQERARLVKLIANDYKRIMLFKKQLAEGTFKAAPEEVLKAEKLIKQIEASLGSFVDAISGQGSKSLTRAHRSNSNIHNNWLAPDWKNYFEKRFGKDNFDIDILKGFLKTIKDAADELDKTKGTPHS